MTGWGQDGPLAQAAGHDIDYIALSGALHGVGRDGRPSPPVNYLGDFGGGGMLLAFAMVSALLAVRNGAPGQVIDCAMTEGSALLTALTRGLHAAGQWRDEAGANLIDGGSPWYDCYRTADGKWIAIGAIEPQFRAVLLDKIGLADPGDEEALRARFTAIFAGRTRDGMVRPARRQRCLLRAGPFARRGAGASAQCRARGVHEPRRRGPAPAGAALL